MATTINLIAGQISDLIEVGPGTRITVTGSAYIDYAQGNVQDAKNGVLTWAKWPKGSSSGTCDTIRRMTIRATATGAATVLIEEGFRDPDTDSGYWQEQQAQLATDAGGNVVGFFSPTCFRDNAQHASTVTGADEVLLSMTIPAAALRADSLLRITTLWSCTNSANSKAFKVLADGQGILSVSQTTVASFHDMHIVRFRSMSSQVTNNSATSSPFGTTSSTGVTTLTVDATDGITLTFVINRSNAGDAAALEAAIVEVF